MNPSRPSRLATLLGFACIYLVWGSTYLGIRVAVESMPPLSMAGLRFAVAGALLYAFCRLRGAERPSAAQWRGQIPVGLCLVGGNALLCWAERRVPSGLSALTVGVAPIFMTLFDWWRPAGTRPSRAAVVGIALGMAGLAILFGPGSFGSGSGPPTIYVAALLVSSAVWCLGSIFSRHVTHKTPPMSAAAIQMLAGGLVMLAVGFLAGEAGQWNPAALSGRSCLALVYLVAVGSLVAFPTYIWLLAHNPPARVATYAYVNPLIALGIGWAFLGETLPLRGLIAAPILVAGIAVITIARGAAPSVRKSLDEVGLLPARARPAGSS